MMEFKPDGGLMKAFWELLGACAQYAGIIGIALFGSTANYIAQIRRKRRIFSIMELIGEWVISGFSALLIALLCEEYSVSWTKTVVLCGIAGHMGGRTMYILETALTKQLRARFPNIFKDIDPEE